MKTIRQVLFMALLLSSSTLLAQKTYIIKMATVAPEGSSWMIEMRNFEKEIIELTNGQIKFRVYPNGIMGGEKDVLRKMRLGQIHSGAFTGVGLGEIVPEIRIFDLPFLFRNSDEVDYVYNSLFDEFQKRFTKKGFFLAGWAEVGFIYLFTKTPVNCLEDFSKVKMWLWKGDPLARTTFKVMNIPSIPLDVTDVHTSLQTGLINGVYISPYGVLALQWFTKTNYMMDYPLTNSVGAVLITTKMLNSMPEDIREIFIVKTKENMRKIVLQGRIENEESIKVLQESGIILSSVKDSKTMAEFDEAGRTIREKLVGKLYSQELLDKVLYLLKEYRSLHGS